MTTNPDTNFIHDLTTLESLFDMVGEASIKKEVSYIHPAYQAMITIASIFLFSDFAYRL